MKIRLDFVTNSSSSSFIFGKPGENKYNYERVYGIFYRCCKILIDSLDKFDEYIKENSLEIYNMYNKACELNKEVEKLNLKYTDSNSIDIKVKITELEEEIEDIFDNIVSTEQYKEAIRFIYKELDYRHYGFDVEDLESSFYSIYCDFYRREQLKELIEDDMTEHIIDFHLDSENNPIDLLGDIAEVICFFESNPINLRDGDINEIALERLGEVAILGYEEYSFPGILNEMLAYESSKYALHI